MGVFFTILFTIVWCVVWGIATQNIITNKGYSENWFWWGFFFGLIALIVALTKPDVRTVYAATEQASQQRDNRMLENGGWECICGRLNPSYTGTCACGKTKQQALERAREQAKREAGSDEITKLEKLKAYKEFLDSGVITKEEYEAKRKEILG